MDSQEVDNAQVHRKRIQRLKKLKCVGRGKIEEERIKQYRQQYKRVFDQSYEQCINSLTPYMNNINRLQQKHIANSLQNSPNMEMHVNGQYPTEVQPHQSNQQNRYHDEQPNFADNDQNQHIERLMQQNNLLKQQFINMHAQNKQYIQTLQQQLTGVATLYRSKAQQIMDTKNKQRRQIQNRIAQKQRDIVDLLKNMEELEQKNTYLMYKIQKEESSMRSYLENQAELNQNRFRQFRDMLDINCRSLEFVVLEYDSDYYIDQVLAQEFVFQQMRALVKSIEKKSHGQYWFSNSANKHGLRDIEQAKQKQEQLIKMLKELRTKYDNKSEQLNQLRSIKSQYINRIVQQKNSIEEYGNENNRITQQLYTVKNMIENIPNIGSNMHL